MIQLLTSTPFVPGSMRRGSRQLHRMRSGHRNHRSAAAETYRISACSVQHTFSCKDVLASNLKEETNNNRTIAYLRGTDSMEAHGYLIAARIVYPVEGKTQTQSGRRFSSIG